MGWSGFTGGKALALYNTDYWPNGAQAPLGGHSYMRARNGPNVLQTNKLRIKTE